MNWLEVSLTVNGELAEAVADVLARHCEGRVVTEQGVQHIDEEDVGTPDGPITVRGYLPEDWGLEERRRGIEEGLHYLGMIQKLPAPVFQTVVERNWMEAWREHYRPIPIGRRLMVLPTWLESPDPSRIAVRIDPGMAFGTGTHPSTQLCLQLLDEQLDPSRGHLGASNDGDAVTLIDVGCGSGILCIAALKLGVKRALGVDVDPASIENARENAVANGLGSEIALEVGSVAEIRAGRFTLRTARLVAVNILAPVITRLFAEGLADLLEPNGFMILAGILDVQEAGVLDAVRAADLSLLDRREMGEWVGLMVSRHGPPPSQADLDLMDPIE